VTKPVTQPCTRPVRPHEALAWNRPHDVHTGAADPLIPNFPDPENLPTA
jgi:hypothetical protein